MKNTTIITKLGIASMAAVMCGTASGAAIAHWSFDTNGADSVGSNDLSPESAAGVSSTNVTFGNTGGAFGGFMNDTADGDYASLASDITLLSSTVADTDGWAVSFWVNDITLSEHIMGDSTNSRTAGALWLRGTTSDPQVQFRIGSDHTITATGATIDITSNWTHYAIVREADSTWTTYIDGTAYSSGDFTTLGAETIGNNFTLNSLGGGEAGHRAGFVGKMDEVWVFDAALSQSEVNSLISTNSISPIPEPSSELELTGFTYDPSTGASEVNIKGSPGTRYELVENSDLDFSTPDQNPVPLTGVTLGTQDGNGVITDGSGNATVQFNLGTAKTFIRAELAP